MIRLGLLLLQKMMKHHGKQFVRLTMLVLATLSFSTSGFLFFEHQLRPDLTWGDAFWWSMVTLTTVGYGDLFPQTPSGRYLIGIPTMVFGISVLGYLLSMVASFFIEQREMFRKGVGEFMLENHILIIHYPGLARIENLIEELRTDEKSKDLPMVLIDQDLEELPKILVEKGMRFVRGNPSHHETLDRANSAQALYAVILAKDPRDSSSDHHSLAAVLTVEKLHSDIVTTVECVEPEHVALFERAGCDNIICLAKLSANLLIQETLDSGVVGVLSELTSNTYGQQIYVVGIRTMLRWTYSELFEYLTEKRILLLGIQRKGHVHLNLENIERIEVGDSAICIAHSRPQDIEIELVQKLKKSA